MDQSAATAYAMQPASPVATRSICRSSLFPRVVSSVAASHWTQVWTRPLVAPGPETLDSRVTGPTFGEWSIAADCNRRRETRVVIAQPSRGNLQVRNGTTLTIRRRRYNMLRALLRYC